MVSYALAVMHHVAISRISRGSSVKALISASVLSLVVIAVPKVNCCAGHGRARLTRSLVKRLLTAWAHLSEMVGAAKEHSNIATVYETLANERELQETKSAFARKANLHRILARLPAPLTAEKHIVGERADFPPGTLVDRSPRTDFLIRVDQNENSRSSKAVSIIAFCGFVLLVTVTLSLWSRSAVAWLDAQGFQVPNLLNRF